MNESILIVDDDKELSGVLRRLLENEGYRVRAAYSAEDGENEINKAEPSLLVLDVKLPGMSGFDLCRKLRIGPDRKSFPIVFLTSKEEATNKVLGFELGGDDYVCKPFNPPELLARIKARLRKPAEPADLLKGGAVALNVPVHEVRIDRKKINLTPKQFDLLCLLLRKKGRVLSRAMIHDSLWGGESGAQETHSIETLVYRLRQRLGKHGDCVQSVGALGYKWRDL